MKPSCLAIDEPQNSCLMVRLILFPKQKKKREEKPKMFSVVKVKVF